jgi:plasmid stability protein
MATMTLKNVPAALVARLKEEAAQNRRSLNREALARLELSLAVRWPSPEEKVERIRRLQARFADLEPMTEEFLERAKTEGRR